MRVYSHLLALALLAPAALAQSVNIDIGTLPGTGSGYAAAAGQPGVWNVATAVATPPGTFLSHTMPPTPLVDLSGAPTGAVFTAPFFAFPYSVGWLPAGPFADLMSDWIESNGAPIVVRVSGLTAGMYVVYTYTKVVDASFTQPSVTVLGSIDGAQLVGPGSTPPQHAQGSTYAVHRVTVNDGLIEVTIDPSIIYLGMVACNGLQIVKVDGVATSVCAGDGTGTPCPCGNMGGAGRGCKSSFYAGGASLAGLGIASLSADSLVLDATNVSNSFATFFQGTTNANGGLGVVFGDGLLCTSGSLLRLGTKLASQGHVLYPTGADLPVSLRGAIGAPGITAYYQAIYRDPFTFCTSATFNTTNAVRVVWAP